MAAYAVFVQRYYFISATLLNSKYLFRYFIILAFLYLQFILFSFYRDDRKTETVRKYINLITDRVTQHTHKHTQAIFVEDKVIGLLRVTIQIHSKTRTDVPRFIYTKKNIVSKNLC